MHTTKIIFSTYHLLRRWLKSFLPFFSKRICRITSNTNNGSTNIKPAFISYLFIIHVYCTQISGISRNFVCDSRQPPFRLELIFTVGTLYKGLWKKSRILSSGEEVSIKLWFSGHQKSLQEWRISCIKSWSSGCSPFVPESYECIVDCALISPI